MTSVQNLRQRSNGNRQLAALCFFVLLISSCSLLKPTTTTEVPVEEKPTEEVTRSVVDTIDLSLVSEDDFVPIRERSVPVTTTTKQRYQVLLTAPFGAEQASLAIDRLSSRRQRLLQFYLGFKHALEHEPMDVGINLSVFDSDGMNLTPEQLRQDPAFMDADLFIGPYLSPNVKAVSDFAKEEGKVVISPWNSTPVVTDNPMYIQMRPSLERHCEALTVFAKGRNPSEELLIITTDSDRDRDIREGIQAVHARLEGDPNAQKLNEFIISDINAEGIMDQFLSIWMTDSVRAIILPLWSNEPFLISVLGKINFAKGNREISVYGLPQWATMERMDYDILENLQVYISATRPIRYQDDQSKDFARSFFERYGVLPDPEAYYGLDMGVWTGHMLEQNGTLITEGLQDANGAGTKQQFSFLEKLQEGGESVGYHINDYIGIMHFEDYQFVPVKDSWR
ncbi:MAG: ABC transporter substrate-binding protein [Saprospiraceae bacterium]|nr:ABC transporter substrate-binding protein [Saprospiraceae bacterium]